MALPAAVSAFLDRVQAWPRLRLTVLALLTLMAYVAAVNHGRGLLWGLASLFLAALVTGLLWPRWLLHRLEISRRIPRRAAEDEEIELAIRVRNPGLLPRYLVEVADRLPFVGAASGPLSREPVLLGQLGSIGGGQEETLSLRVRAEKRGRYAVGPVQLQSAFPLGLAQISRGSADSRASLIIYPSLFAIEALPLRGCPRLIHRGERSLPHGAGSSEYRSLREYQPGDPPRHIHWPSSARSNRLMVREFEPLAAAALAIALDCHPGAQAGEGRRSTFELMVKVAASLARFATEQGLPLRLLGAGNGPEQERQSGDAHFQLLLETLAQVDFAPLPAPDYASLLIQQSASAEPGETLVLFPACSLARGEALLPALMQLQAQGLNLLAVLFDLPSFGGPATPNPDLEALGIPCYTLGRDDDPREVFNR
ncbi:DUF58 domain-containing protein [Azovibrio restrictus]|uniref:DUF58 domain-containing protein n=1 Tax=Azovibrio restrictus TaxID=146938 RepID=UPI0026F31F09|nr:DUF58 domain-containing protein [Azovibrio restrictus]